MPSAIPLWPDIPMTGEIKVPSLTPYLVPGTEPRPAVLVIPGGGYMRVCTAVEGRPMAEGFNRLGVHAFVLHYRTAPHHFPAPLQDGLRAMKIIRGRAAEWGVLADEIFCCGFSAGGHLAGSLGIFPEEADASCGDALDSVDPRPNGLILSYPVVSFGPSGNLLSAKNYCGTVTDEAAARFSLDQRITDKTPPVFIWQTVPDGDVNYQNTMRLAAALSEAGRPCEFHLFPYGEHGMLLGVDTVDVGNWMQLARNFMENCRRSREDGFRERYTYNYQAEAEKKLLAEQDV